MTEKCECGKKGWCNKDHFPKDEPKCEKCGKGYGEHYGEHCDAPINRVSRTFKATHNKDSTNPKKYRICKY